MKNYNNIIYEGSTATIAGVQNKPVKQPVQQSVQQTTPNTGITDMLGKILPLITGIGGVSMLFGKGLFGIGGRKKWYAWWILG